MSDFVELETNIPQTVALAYDDGKLTETRYGAKMFFTLVDGRVLSLKPEAAEQITKLAIRRQQPFCICKREVKGRTGKSTNRIDAWLPDAEGPHAVPDTLEQQLRASLAQVEQRKQAGASVSAPAPVATALPSAQPPYNNGNGTSNGAAKLAPPTKIPYNIAFRELLQIVIDGLKAAGEQWSDSAKQDALSTLLIQASRDGLLTCWERAAPATQPTVPLAQAAPRPPARAKQPAPWTNRGTMRECFARIRGRVGDELYLEGLAMFGGNVDLNWQSGEMALNCYEWLVERAVA